MILSIVVPAYNEADNIINVINRIEDTLGKLPYELIVVNDHSTDSTAELVQNLTVQYSNLRPVENRMRQGFANAIRTGFAEVKTQLVIPVMADLCDDLSSVKEMLKKIDQGYDIVCGSRYIRGGARLGGSKLKGFLSCFVGRSLRHLLGLPTHDTANSFKMYKKTVIDSLDIKSLGFEISMEILLKAYYLGFRITEVPTVWMERTRGKSSFRMCRLFPNYFKLYIWAIFKRLIK